MKHRPPATILVEQTTAMLQQPTHDLHWSHLPHATIIWLYWAATISGVRPLLSRTSSVAPWYVRNEITLI